MQDSNYLDQIAALIKQDPSITVRQIATELKFADSKSVYYWLEKNNVHGIKEFKRRILGDQKSQEETAYHVVQLPLFDWNPKQKNPRQKWYHLHNHPKSRGLFAIRVGTNQFSPWFIQNDILIISENAKYPEGAWVLFKTQEDFVIGKVINKQVVDPHSLQAYQSKLDSVGLILSQQRHFPS